jgi:hypothetical protein
MSCLRIYFAASIPRTWYVIKVWRELDPRSIPSCDSVKTHIHLDGLYHVEIEDKGTLLDKDKNTILSRVREHFNPTSFW